MFNLNHLTNNRKYDIGIYNEKIQSKILRTKNHRRISFDQEPTVKMVEDKVAQCLKSGVLQLQKERFFNNVIRFTTTYEEVLDNKKEKELKKLVSGTWI